MWENGDRFPALIFKKWSDQPKAKEKFCKYKPTSLYCLLFSCYFYSQLNSTEKCPEESDHSQEFHSAECSNDVFFPDIRDTIECGSS